MKIHCPRQAWHDCTYHQTRNGLAGLDQRRLLGAAVQTTDKGVTANAAAHFTLAARIGSAIATLDPRLRVFGDFMYAPQTSARDADDIREAAEELIFARVLARSPRMTAAKRDKLEYVVKGVMRRYRYMHQGGQSANQDPLASPERFRAWLLNEFDVRLASVRWAREWEGFVQRTFECCEEMDGMALSPIAAVIAQMKKAA
ncbi:hypothetical protein [Pseudomonas sp. dw_358]|uniref:hypothetical protein n=1 Tax=Pseudomonas sp. dw_358 TaxID=2720083 RepID=UPI001BD4E71F|nr:hypothetical protein [Pseudomonas sp. dw_358]